MRTVLIRACVVIVVWILVTSIVQQLMCPSMTIVKVFNRIPESFVFNFVNC